MRVGFKDISRNLRSLFFRDLKTNSPLAQLVERVAVLKRSFSGKPGLKKRLPYYKAGSPWFVARANSGKS